MYNFHSQPLELALKVGGITTRPHLKHCQRNVFSPIDQLLPCKCEQDMISIHCPWLVSFPDNFTARERNETIIQCHETDCHPRTCNGSYYVIVVKPPCVSSCRRDGGENCPDCCICCVLLALECVHTRLAPLSSEL